MLTLARCGTRFTDEQTVNVFHAFKARIASQAERGQVELAAPTDSEYQDFLMQSMWRARHRPDLTERQRASILNRLEAAKSHPTPDALTYAALQGAVDEMAEADRLYQREFRFIAGWRAVTAEDAEAYVTKARKAWLALPAEERPQVPQSWVDSYKRSTHRPHHRTSPPTDDATMYAIWRAENDPDAFPNTQRPDGGYVVFDLETTGFSRRGNDIIEIGAIYLDADGNEEGRDSLLFSPTPKPDGTLDTGPVDLHRITPEMVRNQPRFADRAASIRARFENRVMVAHNTTFDYQFLQSKLVDSGLAPLPDMPLIDTARISRSIGVSVPNNKLETLAAHFGVNYGDGHRADSDAEACWHVFNRLRSMRTSAATAA